MRRLRLLSTCIAMSLALNACAQSQAPAQPATSAEPARSMPSQAGTLQVRPIASGLEHPWAVALLPGGDFLVTERPGRLRRIAANGTVSAPIAGVPTVFAQGQGGLLDVVLDPDFASNKRIWLSFAEPGEGDTAGTAVATATLGDATLTNVVLIYRQVPKLEGGNHFGSRIAFDGKGHVFISQGERNERAMAQDLEVLQGKLVRLNVDGTQPADNPFASGVGVRKAIWSYGHRNMQGLAVDPRTGTLWESEHGPRGGDELNLPRAGKNYGWPVITHGINYSGQPIPEAEGKAKDGMEQPFHVWEKSPGVSGMAFYTGRPENPWNDSVFLGSLAERNLIRLTLQGDTVLGEERLLNEIGERVRDVRVGPDGNVYVVTDEEDGKLLRIEPPKAP